MNIISFELSVCSQNVALLEEVRRITCSNADIHKGNETSKVCALQTKSPGYDTDAMLQDVVDNLQKIHTHISTQVENIVDYILDIGIIVSDADQTSIPGVVFSSEYIHLASKLKIKTHFHLQITSSTMRGQLNSGAYFYIVSRDEIDFTALNEIAGIQPTVIYRRGAMGRCTVVAFNAWGLEVSYDNQLPDVPLSALMSKLYNFEKIGRYCKEKDIDSHIDLTCYSIHSDPMDFQLDSSFFYFAEELSVRYVDVDFMN